jgi:2-polyprenyl-3-methyl-5-hydroxy-6-metoxy-1,4-benzoquinol methylase
VNQTGKLSCPLCGSTDRDPFDRRMFRGQLVTNVVCRRCGLVYQWPRMSDEELADFYAAEYRRLYQGQAGPNQADLLVQKARAEALVRFLKPSLTKVETHLDIGCSAGLLLAASREAYGCWVTGVEPGEAYRLYAQEQGLPVYASLEDLAAASPGRFDLASLAHVLEHIADPVGYLASLRESWLSADGWLLVEVPNLYAHDSFEVAHLVSYSPHTLGQTLRKAGYAVVRQELHGRPRSELIPLYLTVLARPAQPRPFQLAPEKNVQLKRRFGMLRRALLTQLYPRRAWLPITE